MMSMDKREHKTKRLSRKKWTCFENVAAIRGDNHGKAPKRDAGEREWTRRIMLTS
jgi:hypothetical protein